MSDQQVRLYPRKRCGLCRQGTASNPFYYDERVTSRRRTVRETELCDDCMAVLRGCYEESELLSLSSLKVFKEHPVVSSWLHVRMVRQANITAQLFFEERRMALAAMK